MTDKGIHHTVAIDAIEQAYGRGKTISHYIDCLKRDKKTGGHPNLVDVIFYIDREEDEFTTADICVAVVVVIVCLFFNK